VASRVVLLFDLDGTLVLTGGAGRRAMEAAFRVVCGASDVLATFSFGGMTDRLIVRTALRGIGHLDDAATVQRILDAYIERLPDEVARSPRYRVLPGVADLVGSLHGANGIALGLGTGNIRAGAMTKLARGGLDGFFAFGGFGCDHEDRALLLQAGAARGAAALGAALEECRVVVIGDTPRDVSAAREMGARCVGVATGGHEPEELLSLGADAAFPDLTHADVRDALLLS
jgi:phosphoglycolate phosphatase-like HAD superfamily hydrolase